MNDQRENVSVIKRSVHPKKTVPLHKEAVSLGLIIKPNELDIEEITCQDIVCFNFIEQNIIGADSQ